MAGAVATGAARAWSPRPAGRAARDNRNRQDRGRSNCPNDSSIQRSSPSSGRCPNTRRLRCRWRRRRGTCRASAALPDRCTAFRFADTFAGRLRPPPPDQAWPDRAAQPPYGAKVNRRRPLAGIDRPHSTTAAEKSERPVLIRISPRLVICPKFPALWRVGVRSTHYNPH